MSPRSCRRGVVLLAALALAGCATTPVARLSKPAFAMPERFDFSGDAPLDRRWWQAFDDPALDNLVHRGLTGNFNLQSAYARVAQARATLAGQRADLFPTLDASLEQSATRRPSSGSRFSRSFGSSTGTTSGFDSSSLSSDGSNWSDSRSLQLSASYEVDLWGRLRNQAEASRFDVRSSSAALQSAAISLAGDIASNWYRLQELRARIDLLNSQIETNQNVLDLTTYSFAHGQSQAADVLRQRQAVASVAGELEQAKASKRVVEHALAVLLGQPPESFVAPPGELVALPALPDTGVPATLLMRRPDVREQLYTLAAADRRVAAAVAARYPQLSLSVTGSSGDEAGGLLSSWTTRLAANLTQPVFDAGARAAEVDRSQAVVADEVGGYQQTLLEALQETEDALTNEYRQKRYLNSLDKQLKLSKQTVDNLRLNYLQGATDYLDVLDALLTRQDLQVQRLTARRQLLDYRINLYRALAGGLDDTPLTGRTPPTAANTAADQDNDAS